MVLSKGVHTQAKGYILILVETLDVCSVLHYGFGGGDMVLVSFLNGSSS